jgi:hypothetical protein
MIVVSMVGGHKQSLVDLLLQRLDMVNRSLSTIALHGIELFRPLSGQDRCCNMSDLVT